MCVYVYLIITTRIHNKNLASTIELARAQRHAFTEESKSQVQETETMFDGSPVAPQNLIKGRAATQFQPSNDCVCQFVPTPGQV